MLNALRPLLLLIAFAVIAPARADDGRVVVRSERENAGNQVREVERDGGRVLRAEPMQRSGREVYRLKVLTPEGRVRVLHDDPRSDTRTRTRQADAPAREPRMDRTPPREPRGADADASPRRTEMPRDRSTRGAQRPARGDDPARQ